MATQTQDALKASATLNGEVPDNLSDALTDLNDAREEAAEREFITPSDLVLKNAESLLRAMYDILPCRYEVYPMPDGEIAIDTPTPFGTAVIATCELDGSVLCFVHTEQDKRYRQFPFAELPNDFLRQGLLKLGRASK